MIRLRRSAAAATFALATLSGCGIVPSSDTAARVDDAVLTQDDLATIVQSAAQQADSPATIDDTIDMRLAREMITVWIVDQAVTSEATTRGLDVPPFEGTSTSPEDLRNHAGQTYQLLAESVTADGPSDADLQAAYDQLNCFNAAQLPGADEAKATIDALNEGGVFVDVVTEQGIEVSGFLGCYPPDSAGQLIAGSFDDRTFVEFSDQLADAEPGSALGPVVTQAGVWVIQRPLVTELAADQAVNLVQNALLPQLLANRDVEIASMYGAFSLTEGVVPLGGAGTDQLNG